MKKYTFVLEWKGGTYLSQYSSPSLKQGIKTWFSNLDMNTLGAQENSKPNYSADISNEEPTALEGLDSVWCISFYIESSLAITHIICTTERTLNKEE